MEDLGDSFGLISQTDGRIDPRRMTGCMHTAVRSLVEALEDAPNTPALTLSILPDSERRQVIEIFNAKKVPYPQDHLIHELFEAQVQRTPDAVAVVFEQQAMTYAELNGKANRLARYLRNRGVGPDQLVGICVDRSLEMVVGLLGILKAGGAYVPLDPSYPAERIKFMLEDSAPLVVLTQEKLVAKLPNTQGEAISLDTKVEDIADCRDDNLSGSELGATSQNLVYVIYTSGSTGRPKGTEMTHRSMCNLLEWQRQTFNAGEGLRVLQFAALSFDVAFQETFSTLCTGGTLVLLNEWIRRDAPALLEFLATHSIERLFVPPLMLQSLAESFKNSSVVPRALRDVVTAGEQLRISTEVAHFFSRLDKCRLHNQYGPTETHVVTALTMIGDPCEWAALPTIGRPISNTQIYILDGQGQPAPIDVPGEIYIGGAGVARGYLRRPELTSQRFIEDPFSSQAHMRMYKTGDLGRWKADGTLEYLGRNDDQVKIRGFRIELGEIEAQLTQHPAVKEAAVIACEDVSGLKRLVAYITSRAENAPKAEELHAHLTTVLPDHMVPSAFVPLENLPLTPNGKLNRRVLPAPDLDAYLVKQYEAPEGETERILAPIWRELLHVERVGRRDNFFKLGGHSLLAMQMIARIRHLFTVELPISAIFKFPTLVQISGHVESLRQACLVDNTLGSDGDQADTLERVSSMP